MSAMVVSLIVFGCVFSGALIGLWIRSMLPEHHLNSESRDVIKVGAGLIGTMTALMLGLLVASAKSSYDTQKNEITQFAAKVVFLDRLLVNYGPDAQSARDDLRASLGRMIDRMWPEEVSAAPNLDPSISGAESVLHGLQELAPQTEAQRALKAQALNIAADLAQMRWLMFEQLGTSISQPFLVMVVFWLAIIFMSFGLFAPRNHTVIVALLLCALSVSGALFLILELDHPFDGMIRVPSTSMNSALSHLGAQVQATQPHG